MYHAVDESLPWLLTVRAPHRAKRAVLRAATHGLHRCPHVPAGGQQIPARRHEPIARYAPPVVHARGPTRDAISDDGRPDHIPVASDHDVCAAMSVRFVWEESRVDPTKHHPCPPFPRLPSDFVSTQGVAGVDADADDISRCDG